MEDNEIVLLLKKGDKQAYKALFVTYYSSLCEYASLYIQDDEAEEVVEDLMLYLWESRENIFIETSLKSYLFSAVKHRCLNAIKQKQYHEKVHEQLYEKMKEQFEEPDYYLLNELAKQIQLAIDELPDSYRETFKMSRFGDASNLEIAERSGVSVKTIEYRITQSLKILRVKLKDYLPIIYLCISELL